MSESMRDRIRDELAGWVIGSGYYATAVSVEDARDMADAVLAVLADPPSDVIEAGARALAELEPGEAWPSNYELGGGPTGTRDDEYRSELRDQARTVLVAVFRGDRD